MMAGEICAVLMCSRLSLSNRRISYSDGHRGLGTLRRVILAKRRSVCGGESHRLTRLVQFAESGLSYLAPGAGWRAAGCA